MRQRLLLNILINLTSSYTVRYIEIEIEEKQSPDKSIHFLPLSSEDQLKTEKTIRSSIVKTFRETRK